MALWADNKGRFVFAPDALNGASPYIDRMQVNMTIPAQFLETDRFSDFLDGLAGTVFSARRGHETSIRAGWLFAGKLRLQRAQSGRESNEIVLELNLNPTRFLQAHNVPNDTATRRQIFTNARQTLREIPNAVHTQRLQHTKQITFDRNDNFISHHDNVHGPIEDWSQRTTEYLEGVYSLIREEIVSALTHLLHDGFNGHFIPQMDRVSCRLSSIEFYWEYAVDNAISKVHEVSGDFKSVLRNTSQTEFSANREREFGEGRHINSPFVKGLLGRKEIGAKLYSKAAHIVRFEVTFHQQPLQTLTGDRSQRFSRRGRSSLPSSRQIDLLSDEASSRATQFWQDFWLRMAQTPTPDRTTLFRLLERLARAVEGTAVSLPELISTLIEEGGVEQFISPRDDRDPVVRLLDDGVLIRVGSTPNNRARYRFRADLMPLIHLLNTGHHESAQEIDTGDPALLQHEERPAVRVRPRSYCRLQAE